MIGNTALKITIIVAIFSTLLLTVLNLVVVERSKEALISVIRRAPIEFDPTSQEHIRFGLLSTVENSKGPLQLFSEEFHNSLIIMNVVGIIASIGIGFLVSRIITHPLRQLEHGVKKLKENDYKFTLKNTGTEEFDKVIAEFNYLAKELARVESLRMDLISDTTHELKTPITALLGQLEGVKDGFLTFDKKRIEIILLQVKRLNNLVEKLQEYSKLRSKTAKLNMSNFKVKPVITEIFNLYQKQLQAKKIKVNIDIPGNFILIADKSLFERVIINLLENALKYSKADAITITLKAGQLCFADNGIGIPDIHFPYIFERFYRVEKSRNRKFGGLGLGLAIVKEIIEAHGWKIYVEKAINKGIKFCINISVSTSTTQ